MKPSDFRVCESQWYTVLASCVRDCDSRLWWFLLVIVLLIFYERIRFLHIWKIHWFLTLKLARKVTLAIIIPKLTNDAYEIDETLLFLLAFVRLRSPMDTASTFSAGDCVFDCRRCWIFWPLFHWCFVKE